jgi:hypothetical protein
MSEQEKDTFTRIEDNPEDVQRGALLDLTIAVAGAGAYDALKSGAKQVKGKLSEGDKSKD